MDLAQYFQPLRKWWWLLVISAAFAAASSYYVVSQQPPVYQATATLLTGSAFGDPNPTDSELYLGERLARTYANLGLRRPIQEKTMAAIGQNWLPDYIVRPVPNSQLLEILVTSTDPLLAQRVANELANQLILQTPRSPGSEDQERQAFIDNQLTVLQERIQETEEEIVKQQQELEEAFSAREISDLQAEIGGLQSKLTSLQENYGLLLSSSDGGAINTLTLIEPAPIPQQPIGPGRMQTVLITVMVALTLSAGTAYLLVYLDDTINNSDDVSRASNLRHLPSIPFIRATGGSEPIISFEESLVSAVDAFRALRTVVQFRIKDKTNPVILVTSSMPEDGKSTVSANLAVVFSQAGSTVLLVDADMRRPALNRLFGLSDLNGFAKFMLKYKSNSTALYMEDLLENCIEQSAQTNLWIMHSGASNHMDSQMPGMAILDEVLSAASNRFDYIIIDSAPLLATSDSLSISAKVDGVILLARAGKTRRKELESVTTQLTMVEANVLGIVLNRVKRDHTAYAYNYYGPYAKKSKTEPLKHQPAKTAGEIRPTTSEGKPSEQVTELPQT